MALTLPEFHVNPDSVLLDRYRLEKRIAAGGMGEIWQGSDSRLRSPVAVKFLTRNDELARRRFQDEAEIAARLLGPHIVRIFDRGEFGGVPFLVMELLQGETLRQRLRIERRLSPRDTLRVIEQVGEGLAPAHQAGIIHRDIKPENIFLSGNAERFVIKLLDFGIAKSTCSQSTQTGDLVGTPLYASPEQLADSSRLGPQSDLWALAVVTFESLIGQRPFRANNLSESLEAIARGKPASELMDRLPGPLKHWFELAFSPNQGDRPHDVATFVDSLKRAMADSKGEVSMSVVTEDRPSDQKLRPRPFPRAPGTKRWWITGVSAAALLAGLAFFTLAERAITPPVSEEPISKSERPDPASPPAPPSDASTAVSKPVSEAPGDKVTSPASPETTSSEPAPSANTSPPSRPAPRPQPLVRAQPPKSTSKNSSADSAANKAQPEKQLADPSEEELLWSRRK